MNLLNYTLTLTVSFLGLILGIILAYIAKEELKQGKKYFILLQKVTLALISSFFIYYFISSYLILALSFLAFFILTHLFINKLKTYYIYPFLALIFYLSSNNTNLLKTQAFLIFLFGFPTGSLLIKIKEKNYFKIVLQHVSFVVIGLLVFLIF